MNQDAKIFISKDSAYFYDIYFMVLDKEGENILRGFEMV